MRLALILVGLALLPLIGVSVLFRFPPQVPATVITIIGMALGVLLPRMSEEGKIIWLICVCALGIVTIYSSFRSEAGHRQELDTARQRFDEKFDSQEKRFEQRFDEQKKRSDELLALASASQATMAELSKASVGGLKRSVLSLSGRIIGFLVDRRKGEPPQEIAMFVLPMPVGNYADYIFETGELEPIR